MSTTKDIRRVRHFILQAVRITEVEDGDSPPPDSGEEAEERHDLDLIGTGGYVSCACRDCMEIAIGARGDAICSDCEEAGCEAGAEAECSARGAYGEDVEQG
jgi:hypothetical protein